MPDSLQQLIEAAKAEAEASTAQTAQADTAVQPAQEATVTEAQDAVTQPETTAPEQVEASTGSDTQSGKDSQDEPASWLRQFVSKAGFEVDGVPDSEIEEFVAKQIKPATVEVKEEPVAPVTQQEAVVSEGVATSAESSKAEPPARKVQPLKFDAELAEFVTFDDKGNAVPKPELGAEGIAAAKKLNSYATERRKRIEALADDPVGVVKDDLLGEVERLVAERLAKHDADLKARQEAERQQFTAQTRAQQEQEQLQRLLTESRTKLYVCGEDGEPKRLIKGGEPVMTPYGKEVDSLYLELKQTSRPDVSDAVLIAKAMRLADKLHAAAPVDPQAKASEVAAKKAAFLDQGKKHVPTVTIDKPPATLEEMIASGQKLSLADMIKLDAANQGNPVLSKLG